MHGNIEEVKKLKSMGVDINITEFGRTPLREAVLHDYRDLVKFLLESGAKSYDGLQFWAAKKRHYDIIQILIERKELNESCLGPAVAWAARKKDHEMIGLILPQIVQLKYLHSTLCFKDKDALNKTALEWALQTGCKFSISHLLFHEHKCHQRDKVGGLKCIKDQLTYNSDLKSVIRQFTEQYEKRPWEKRIEGSIAIIPVLLSFSLFSFDTISDTVLSKDYYSCSDLVGNLSSALPDRINCMELNRTSEDYTMAFITNVGLIIASVGASISMVIFSSGIHGLMKVLWKEEVGTTFLICLFSTLMFPPLFILVSHAYLKYQHTSSSKKDVYLEHLHTSEFHWGILSMLEAGIESSLQLILQTWLISNLFTPGGIDIDGIIGIVRGILLLDSASSLERSLGKMLVSLASVVFSIGGCYRYQKRGSVGLVDMIPIYISLLSAIIGRLIAFAAFFSTKASFGTWMPVLYLFHTSSVLLIKLIWEVDCLHRPAKSHRMTFRRFLIALLSSAASFLVYVRIKSKDNERSRGTFHIHLYFFLLIIVENILLATSPFMVQDGLWSSETRLISLPFMVLGLWIISCLSHLFFYKLFGHPWGVVNGPYDQSCRGLMCGSCTMNGHDDINMEMQVMSDTPGAEDDSTPSLLQTNSIEVRPYFKLEQ